MKDISSSKNYYSRRRKFNDNTKENLLKFNDSSTSNRCTLKSNLKITNSDHS